MSTLRFSILGASVSGDDLIGWDQFLARLKGFPADPDARIPPTTLLSARERRRSPATVRLALSVAEEACRHAGVEPRLPRAVFASAMGDVEITDYLCSTLADAPEMLSPTRFHNSVHNAASGYWSIGADARGDVTAISAHQDSASQGLLEASLRLMDDPAPVLLVCYDLAADSPIRDVWTPRHSFAAAVVLGPPDHPDALARIALEACHKEIDQARLPEAADRLMVDNPAAGILDLLVLAADIPDFRIRFMQPVRGPVLQLTRLDDPEQGNPP